MNDRELLKKARKKLGWSQSDLASYFKVNQQKTISHWETGVETPPQSVLKMARQVKKMSKKDARKEFELAYSLEGKTTLHETRTVEGSKDKLAYFLGADFTKKEVVSDFLSFFSPDTLERAVLDEYIAFRESKKREGKCFPTAQDFKDGTFKTTSEAEVVGFFGTLPTAKRLAGKLKQCLIKEKKREARRMAAQIFPLPSGKIVEIGGDRGFPCSMCGKIWIGAPQFYDALEKFIIEKIDEAVANTDGNGMQEIKKALFENERCFCGSKMDRDFKSSFKTIVLGRLNKLNPVDDVKVAIFGKGSR